MAQYQHASRNTELGDRACFCTVCGWARRYFPGVVEPPAACPDCQGAVAAACPDCGESILSVMATDCDLCGAALREKVTEAGVQVRRPKRLPVTNQSPPACQ